MRNSPVKVGHKYRVVKLHPDLSILTGDVLDKVGIVLGCDPHKPKPYADPLPDGRWVDITFKIVDAPNLSRVYRLEGVLIRKVKVKPTCICPAYPYPHRMGGGECELEP